LFVQGGFGEAAETEKVMEKIYLGLKANDRLFEGWHMPPEFFGIGVPREFSGLKGMGFLKVLFSG
jgi:hypothetical protein